MTFPLLPRTFTAVGDALGQQAVAHLRQAQRLPLRVRGFGAARYADPDPDLSRWSFEREVDLGTCPDLVRAIALAESTAASGTMAYRHDETLRLVPEFVTVIDVDHALVLAGDVRGHGIRWCDPVRSDAEARAVVCQASRLRAAALAAADHGDTRTATALRCQARGLEGRLVDPFWRDLVAGTLRQPRAA